MYLLTLFCFVLPFATPHHSYLQKMLPAPLPQVVTRHCQQHSLPDLLMLVLLSVLTVALQGVQVAADDGYSYVARAAQPAGFFDASLNIILVVGPVVVVLICGIMSCADSILSYVRGCLSVVGIMEEKHEIVINFKHVKGQKCNECKRAKSTLHVDPSNGMLYCTACWEKFYGKGSAPESFNGFAESSNDVSVAPPLFINNQPTKTVKKANGFGKQMVTQHTMKQRSCCCRQIGAVPVDYAIADGKATRSSTVRFKGKYNILERCSCSGLAPSCTPACRNLFCMCCYADASTFTLNQDGKKFYTVRHGRANRGEYLSVSTNGEITTTAVDLTMSSCQHCRSACCTAEYVEYPVQIRDRAGKVVLTQRKSYVGCCAPCDALTKCECARGCRALCNCCGGFCGCTSLGCTSDCCADGTSRGQTNCCCQTSQGKPECCSERGECAAIFNLCGGHIDQGCCNASVGSDCCVRYCNSCFAVCMNPTDDGGGCFGLCMKGGCCRGACQTFGCCCPHRWGGGCCMLKSDNSQIRTGCCCGCGKVDWYEPFDVEGAKFYGPPEDKSGKVVAKITHKMNLHKTQALWCMRSSSLSNVYHTAIDMPKKYATSEWQGLLGWTMIKEHLEVIMPMFW